MPALTPDRIDGFLEVAFAEPPSAERRARLDELVQDAAWAARRRYACGPDGSVSAALWLVVDDDEMRLVGPRCRDPIGPAEASLVDEGVAVARAQGAERAELRIAEGRCSQAVVEACLRTGAVDGPGRVEHEAQLAELPRPLPGDAQRLVFDPAPDEATAAAVLGRTALDSPDVPAQAPEVVIREILTQPRRTHELGAVIHLGHRPGDPEPIAFVCAQIDPSDGWSTITMLAIDPEHRGQGLGPVLHRHGLAMLRAQGGVIYRGGTSLTNASMRACFAANRVPEVQRFRVFRWALSPRPPGGSS